MPPLAFVLFVENDFVDKPAAAPGEFRLVHWNTGGRPDRPGVGEFLVAERADVYVFAEVPSLAWVEKFREMLDEPAAYQSVEFGGLAVVGRGKLRCDGLVVDRDRFKMMPVEWRPDGQAMWVMVVDLPSEPWVPRDPLLRSVNRIVQEYQAHVVVGDFNAPRRSWELSRLPPGYSHAYHTVGGGWGYTGPVPLPVYALDHCLHGPRIAPAHYRLSGMSGNSDHRYQVFDFSVVGN